MALSGHYDCVNCGGSVSALFGFLVIAFGVLIFGVYATMQRRQSRNAPQGQTGEENVLVDQEGWETKVSDSGDNADLNESKGGENRQARVPGGGETTDTEVPGEDEGWETKPEN